MDFKQQRDKFMEMVCLYVRVDQAVKGDCYWDEHLQAVIFRVTLGSVHSEVVVRPQDIFFAAHNDELRIVAKNVAQQLLTTAFQEHLNRIDEHERNSCRHVSRDMS